MAVTFRGMNAKDYMRLGPSVVSAGSMDSFYALDPRSELGDFSTSDVEQSLQKQHVRQVIQLCVPTFNFVLGGSGGNLLAKILGIPNKTWKKIVSIDLVYDRVEDKLISLDSATSDGSYLYGAEVAEHLINELDIQEAKKECIYAAMQDSFKSSVDCRTVVDVNTVGKGQHISANFYINYNISEVTSCLKRNHSVFDLVDELKESLFSNHQQRFTYLLNMKQDKSGLYAMLNYYIAVIPVEMRPKIEMGEHKLTARYVSVINANQELETVLSEYANPKDVKIRYDALNKAVARLQYKNYGLKLKDVKPDDLAILERVKSKKGQIRMNNFGKRQDYSGRAVVAINPYLPLDHIRIPRVMLPKLFAYHVLPFMMQNKLSSETEQGSIYSKTRWFNFDDPDVQEEVIRLVNENQLLNYIPVVLGRQPTLHRQSLQAFYAEITDLNAIEVNPLVCPAFNMDFDGDQGHVEIPLSAAAIEDVRNLLLTTQNLFLSKTGECTIEPRQDMLYGLYMCTRSDYSLGSSVSSMSFETFEDCRTAIIQHKIRVSDTVNVLECGGQVLAGDAAFIACFPKGDVVPRNAQTPHGQLCVEQITSKTITKYVDHLLRLNPDGSFVHNIGSGYASRETFVGAINRLVELGFKVARIYAPSMSLLTASYKSNESSVKQFYKNMEEVSFYYDIGMETSDNFKIEFDKQLKHLEDTSSKNIFSTVGEESGYTLLSKSGARGSKDNLKQAFAYKGRVKKDQHTAFDTLVQNCYATQLTPMEHFVSAYGARQGQADKSLKTGDTGYVERQLWHAQQGLVITCDDCKTTKGLKVSKKFLTTIVPTPDSVGEEANKQIKEEVALIFAHAIRGRYRVNSNKVITDGEAVKWANDDSIDEIEIRSPIFCNNPCCKKCYGLDWGTRKEAVVGSHEGVTSAQSIGEPSSQLVLKQFQKGGVSGKAEFASAFDKLSAYIHVQDLASLTNNGRYSGYDPLAWDSGVVTEVPSTNVENKIVSIGNNPKRITVPRTVVLKNEAVKGEGLAYRHGDYSLPEMLKHCGIEETQRYMAFKLFMIYKEEVKIAMIHFEALVACCTRYMITHTTRSDLMIGQYCTRSELYRGSLADTEYIPRLISCKSVLQASMEALDAVMMEEQGDGLAHVCLLNLHDSLSKPLNSIVLGQRIKTGSALQNYTDARKEKIW